MNVWTVNLVLLLPFFAGLGVIYLWLYFKKREARKFPFTDDVLRSPGESLSQKAEELSFDLSMYFGLVPLVPVMVYAVYLQGIAIDGEVPPAVAVMLLLIASAAVSYLLIRMYRILSERHNYQLGYAGEVAVGSALNELMRQGYYVFHDVKGDGEYNVDHIVVGPTGVFAVETKAKTKSKKVLPARAYKVGYDGKYLYFPDCPGAKQRGFIGQAERGAKWVGKWLSEATGETINAIPVLVMPGWYIDRTGPGGILVLNHNQLETLTKQGDGRLDQKTIKGIAYQIKQRCLNEQIKPKSLRG